MRLSVWSQWKDSDNFDLFCFGFFNTEYCFDIDLIVFGIGITLEFDK